MAVIGRVEIKPECRKTHGKVGAFDEAMKELEKNYKLWMDNESLEKATYVIELKIKQE